MLNKESITTIEIILLSLEGHSLKKLCNLFRKRCLVNYEITGATVKNDYEIINGVVK